MAICLQKFAPIHQYSTQLQSIDYQIPSKSYIKIDFNLIIIDLISPSPTT
jgi:hypothetical protein